MTFDEYVNLVRQEVAAKSLTRLPGNLLLSDLHEWERRVRGFWLNGSTVHACSEAMIGKLRRQQRSMR